MANPEMSYQDFAKLAPPGKLELVLDEEHNGVDTHLGLIADELDEGEMETSLCPALGLKTKPDINNVVNSKRYRDEPAQIRRQLLLKWKTVAGPKATYENLIKALVKVRDLHCANFIVKLWDAKPKSGDTKSSSVKEKKAGQEDGKGSKGEGPPPESMQPLPRPLVALEPPKDNEATKRPRDLLVGQPPPEKKSKAIPGPVPISERLFYALMMVKSCGNKDAVGDNGRAIGPFQIHKAYWLDAANLDPSLREDGQSYENCCGEGSVEYSKRVVQAYTNRYATEGRLGRAPTDEDITRIHEGGPNGYKNPKTMAHWENVKRFL